MKVGQEKNRKGDASHNINRLKSLVMAGLKSAVQLISREKVYLGSAQVTLSKTKEHMRFCATKPNPPRHPMPARSDTINRTHAPP